MRVAYEPRLRLWLLTGTSTAYAVRLDADDCVRHVHWGAPVTVEEAAALVGQEPPDPAASSFEEKAGADELPVEGGAHFGPAALQVRWADLGRGIEWKYLGHEIVEDAHLRIDLADRHYPLTVKLHYRMRGDVVERWTEVTNTGHEPVTLQRCDSAAWTVPAGPRRLSHLVGAWNSEFRLRRGELAAAETVLTSRRGLTSHHANPWLALDDGTAGEEHGEVWSTALAWSGSWRVTVQRDPGGRTGWTGGFGHEGLTWTLTAGETLRTPVFAGVYSTAGFGGVSRTWHAYIRANILPHPEELRPVLYNSWEATHFDVDEAGQIALARRAAEVGAEMFVMDDGWFGRRANERKGLGDWTPNPERFPHGLTNLVAAVRQSGMKFGIWVEPEMVNPDSDLYREHPDWVLHTANRRRTEMRHQLVLNLARPDVRDWTHAWLDRLVGEHGIDFLKWDCNRPFTEAGWPGHADPDRVYLDHTRAVHQIMDRLRAGHPGLRIESCAGGGGRADLGILARTDQVWPSDNTDPIDRIAIQNGFAQVFPAQVMGAWVTDSPNVTTARSTPLRFRFHVSMAGVLGLGGDLTTWTPDELEEAADLVREYKRVRPVVQHGTAYRLTGAGTLTGVQYTLNDDHVILAWLPSRPYGHTPGPLPLSAVEAGAVYRDLDTGRTYQGAVLQEKGLPLDMPAGDHASALVRLTRLP
ncbi:alpha-galactosidase [Actinoplanes sp. TBRC 11911]|uniref:alpha-galactosidase n=1 Tax=Actinoplanes sp. TBRC 11911 TaxID=2729386 RepID=UPI00145FC0A2|nr:alpha-galactosidase [Actinoplanes sp. TBRC 11911]NMO54049.1 alpha-galactosidase [Actinoplanes sp. TBRC 11911]